MLLLFAVHCALKIKREEVTVVTSPGLHKALDWSCHFTNIYPVRDAAVPIVNGFVSAN